MAIKSVKTHLRGRIIMAQVHYRIWSKKKMCLLVCSGAVESTLVYWRAAILWYLPKGERSLVQHFAFFYLILLFWQRIILLMSYRAMTILVIILTTISCFRIPYFLLFLRLFPASPNWAINMCCGVLNVPIHIFFITALVRFVWVKSRYYNFYLLTVTGVFSWRYKGIFLMP